MAAPMSRKFSTRILPIFHRIIRCGDCHFLRTGSLVHYASSYCGRSHSCGELRSDNIGQRVKLKGWVQNKRFGMFLVVRDAYGLTQLIVPPDQVDLVKSLPVESVIEVEGEVAPRKPGEENKKMPTGDVEVLVDKLKILNRSKTLPIDVNNYRKVGETGRLEYRYLDLRSELMQRNLRFRSSIINNIRHFLCQIHGFVDVETPTLFRRTPGGAREFIVPSHLSNKFYCLPQSPQQFKQLLMVGGLDRYMQIARCYRDESQRPDRQPEFTQLDVEMSFVDSNDVMTLIEDLLTYTWPSQRGPLRPPFTRMTYSDALNSYGTDKPDLRFDMKISDVTVAMETSGLELFSCLRQEGGTARAFVVRQADQLKKKDFVGLKDQSKENVLVTTLLIGGDGKWRGALANQLSDDIRAQLSEQLRLQPRDGVILAWGQQNDVLPTLGKIRLQVADWLESGGHMTRQGDHFVWITDFPLFELSDEGGWNSTHHPFTAPHPDDLELIYTQPGKVRGLHYDLVLNGNEIGGGSIRIHDPRLQTYILHNILQEETSQLRHLLEALEYGAPPHGGIALGLDRLIALLCDVTNIRDVIAFPKSLDGKDLMSGAPAPISQSELDYYRIASADPIT